MGWLILAGAAGFVLGALVMGVLAWQLILYGDRLAFGPRQDQQDGNGG